MPRDDVATLSPEQRARFERASAEYDDPRDRMRLLAFLMDCDFDEDVAHEKMEDLQALLSKLRVPTIDEVAKYYASDADGRPPVAPALLEDGHGNVARARDGSPIVVGCGALAASSEERIRVMAFVFSRLERYVADTEIPRVTFVSDLLARKGTHVWEGPDWSLGSFLTAFPLCFRGYACGVEAWMETAATTTIKVSRTFRTGDVGDKYKCSEDYSCLAEDIAPDNMLPQWHPDASFAFSYDEYVQYLRR